MGDRCSKGGKLKESGGVDGLWWIMGVRRDMTWGATGEPRGVLEGMVLNSR
jgi:hypothetical protein